MYVMRQSKLDQATWLVLGVGSAAGAVVGFGLPGIAAELVVGCFCGSMALMRDEISSDGVRMRFGTRLNRLVPWSEVTMIRVTPGDVKLHLEDRWVTLPTSRVLGPRHKPDARTRAFADALRRYAPPALSEQDDL